MGGGGASQVNNTVTKAGNILFLFIGSDSI